MNHQLTANWLLSDLMPDEAARLYKHALLLTMNAGTSLITANKPNDSLWIIVSGRVGVIAQNDKGVESQVAELLEGDLAGEMSWLDGHPASASTVVLDQGTQVLRITFHEFEKFLGTHPDAHIQILRKFAINLSHRLRK